MSEILNYFFEISHMLVERFSYFGIYIAMAVESATVPLPSEAIMGFAGFMVAEGVFKFPLAVLAGVLGNASGSTVTYMIGKYGGYPVVDKYGRYLSISKVELEKMEKWFAKYGYITVFAAQVIPVIRTFVSIPAGITKLNYFKFIIATAAGASVWCSFLVYMGKILGDNWESISGYVEPFQNVIIVLCIIGFVYYIYRHYANRNHIG